MRRRSLFSMFLLHWLNFVEASQQQYRSCAGACIRSDTQDSLPDIFISSVLKEHYHE